ncbi:hypothetical protein PFICI_06128 [Pestalotiopsis fici W106-1]|uniref:CHAT domain-containing protein n=1 Tax=Pestalotiopsis fici (strain W106-1 / CGMCC3.15140) TaxID=1229662 RepID=W3X7H9_PESFW|nr:uncharacterized protein PFICI_06128 [Pestalotiopsis fici W106-1]ETS81126.1 hypothetical protein PFICI_06128 [Pestalotiopsis fici W106-1]
MATKENSKTTPRDIIDVETIINDIRNQHQQCTETNAMEDLELLITMMWQAIEAIPKDHPDYAKILSGLATQLGSRYTLTKATKNLEEAIVILRRAVEVTSRKPSQDFTGHIEPLHNLGTFLTYRFMGTGSASDLEEGINLARQAVHEATQLNYPRLITLLNSLSIRLQRRYTLTGNILDLDESITTARKAIEESSQKDPNHAAYLNTLGMILRSRYTRTGAREDLEESIILARQVIKETPRNNPDLPGWLNNLGVGLKYRYTLIGAIADLEEAIIAAREAVQATPRNHVDLGRHLNSLGVFLRDRYGVKRGMADLDEYIKVMQQAVEVTPQDHIDSSQWLNNLGLAFFDRYRTTEAIADLEQSITTASQAVEATPQDHPNFSRWLYNLGNRYGDRYARTGEISDLNDSITTIQQAANAIPQEHPYIADVLTGLGDRLRERYAKTEMMADLEASVQHFETALNNPTSLMVPRLRASHNLLSMSSVLQNKTHALRHARTAIYLLPQLAPRSLKSTDKHQALMQAAGLASNAAAIALHAGQPPSIAIEWLEIGRGVLAGSLQDMRSDISMLMQKHPALGTSFQRLRDFLDAPAQQSMSTSASPPLERADFTVQSSTDERIQTQKQLEELVNEIRRQPGFDRFLLPPSETDILKVGADGPVVVINVSTHRCDALIIHEHQMNCLELPHVTEEEIIEQRRHVSKSSLLMLEWLWDGIVSPVLESLGFTQTPSDGNWPRIWWIPTGPLVGFPLHAAGYHLDKASRTALDRVISSYAISIKAIMHTRGQSRSRVECLSTQRLVLVAMQDTPGLDQGWLQHAEEEVAGVRKIGSSMQLLISEPTKSKKEVLSAMEGCEIFHFAGHGDTNQSWPLQSHLLLDDWKQDPLTIESLLETNLQRRAPYLAYLSACGSGRVLNDASFDEGIHLISAFQLAGFRHVIGTLWNVDDRLCGDMARLVYEALKDGRLRDESPSRGLHFATKQLRDKWIKDFRTAMRSSMQELATSRDVEAVDESEIEGLPWVPYVHYGV